MDSNTLPLLRLHSAKLELEAILHQSLLTASVHSWCPPKSGWLTITTEQTEKPAACAGLKAHSTYSSTAEREGVKHPPQTPFFPLFISFPLHARQPHLGIACSNPHSSCTDPYADHLSTDISGSVVGASECRKYTWARKPDQLFCTFSLSETPPQALQATKPSD